ncbi:MAG TPA: nucleotidyltransferase domain-containing protein [Actinocrinis sp.]|nr:nucleotidyltransferase domain-containing protein [Actinocrinis sp.]
MTADLDPQAQIILSGIVGSIAYGLAGPGSDIDRLGFFALPTLRLLGLVQPQPSVVSAKPDSTMHEVGKAVSLLLACNPTVTELLWLPEDLYEVQTPLGRELIALRGSLLSANKVKSAYLGYATQQLRKLASGDEPACAGQRPRVAKHARHLMRLVHQGYDLYTTGRMSVRLADPQRHLDFGEQVAERPDRAAQFMAQAEERFAGARSVLPQAPDEAAAQDWLLGVRKALWLER